MDKEQFEQHKKNKGLFNYSAFKVSMLRMTLDFTNMLADNTELSHRVASSLEGLATQMLGSARTIREFLDVEVFYKHPVAKDLQAIIAQESCLDILGIYHKQIPGIYKVCQHIKSLMPDAKITITKTGYPWEMPAVLITKKVISDKLYKECLNHKVEFVDFNLEIYRKAN
jgi:hypothetical protein